MTKGVENLINKRNIIKDKFSRMQTFIEQFNDSEQSITELKVRVPTINAMFNQFDEIQDKIEESKSVSDDDDERLNFESNYFQVLALIEQHIENFEMNKASNHQIPLRNQIQNPLQVKLPTLELPKFDGNYAEYHSFLDRFNRSVHMNEKLSNADKLQYLKGCLIGEASASINVVKVTNDNYPKALEILEKRFNILRSLNSPIPGPSKLGMGDKATNHLTNKSKKTSNYVSINKPTCDICNKTDHRVAFKCPDFLNLSINERIKKAKQLSLCLKCLGKGNHSQDKCRIKWCVICKQAHNVLIHKDDDSQLLNDEPSIQEQSSSVPTTSTSLFTGTNQTQVLLSTALVMVDDGVGRKHQLRCLLDNASQSCFITKQAFDKLRLPSLPTNFLVASINQNNTAINRLVRITMYSNNFNFVTNINCLIVKEISTQLPSQFFDIDQLQIPSNIKLADSNFNIPGEIDMLIGADVFWQIIRSGHLPLGKGLPILQNTCLGWLVGGAVNYPISKQFMTSCNFSSIQRLETQMQRFWEIEQVGIKPSLTQTEMYCEEHFKKYHKRDAEGRFVVKLPFKPDAPTFGNSKQLALSRFLKLEKRLESQPSLKKEYHKIISEYINQNYLKPIASNDVDTKDAFYLPHHSVIKESSLTTKVRIVFDASAKSDSGVSLNDALYSGPALQQDLFSILCRFRMHQFVISADITKMYLQIGLDKSQRRYQRILWRDDKSDEIKTYNLTTVTFGITSSPFLAVRCLNELAFLNQNDFGMASQVILNDFYIDDLLSGGNTIQETKQLRNDIVNILNQAKFALAKWSSNDIRLLEGLNDTVANKLFAKEHMVHTTKTLGLSWHSQNDVITYQIKAFIHNKITKRYILSVVAQIFDPLGLLSPVIIPFKILLQRLWSLKTDWDEPVDNNHANDFLKNIDNMRVLNAFKIPRKVIPVYPYKQIELHTFSDASQFAYGCCAFIRIQDLNNKYHVHLLCAKSKVAPLKTVTIPRLELCAALLSAQLASKLITILNTKFVKTYFWCDSTIVLSWLSFPSNTWKIFVSNRVSEIHSLCDKTRWYHVATKDNPADLVSRGSSSNHLINSELWFNGPKFLKENISHLKSFSCKEGKPDTLPEQKVATLTTSILVSLPFIQKFSSFTKLTRIFAYLYRFITNCKDVNKRESYKSNDITVEELKRAEMKTLIIAQRQFYLDEVTTLQNDKKLKNTSKLVNLNPFLDEDGVLRVRSRLSNASHMKFNAKFPIILPKQHHITKLIITYQHRMLLHAGVQATLYALRQNYWVPGGKSLVKKIIHGCISCFRNKPSGMRPLVGDLPSTRLEPLRPFTNCGVDFGGPFLIKQGNVRSRKTTKAYLCLFVCFSTKAIHLELVSDLTTHAFLNCFKRFIARRGVIKNIYSDNATNFVGAKNELKDLEMLWRNQNFKNELETFMSKYKTKWHFIPPRAPHFGGIWERGIRSVKDHIKRVIGQTSLTYEEFFTVLACIEACLNSRPITSLSNDPNDLLPLTPGHFLIGEPPALIVEPDYTEIKLNRLSRYQLIEQMRQHFWRRWHKEYLTTLQQVPKWQKAADTNLETGAMIILKEDNLPPLQWKLGRVQETFPGSDGVVRVVNVKTASGVFKRPVNKLCKLPIT